MPVRIQTGAARSCRRARRRSPLPVLAVPSAAGAAGKTAEPPAPPARHVEGASRRSAAGPAPAAPRRRNGHPSRRRIPPRRSRRQPAGRRRPSPRDRRLEPQGGVGHAQHVVDGRDLDGDVGRHAGAQLAVRVRHRDDHRVGDDVLGDGGVQAHLRDLAAELLVGIGVDVEARHLADLDLPDVRLVDVGLHLHLGQVLGDGEQGRRREGGGDRLADVVLAGHHLAVDRRVDLGVAQVGLRLVQGRLRQRERGARAVVGRLGGVEVGLRDQPGVGQPLLAAVGDLVVGHVHLGLGHVGLLLLHLLEERRRVELGQELPLLHLAVEVGVELGNDAGDLAADLHRDDGGDRARGAHRHGDVAAVDRLGAVGLAAVALAAPQEKQPDQHRHDQHDGDRQPAPLLVVVLQWIHVRLEREEPAEVSRIPRSSPFFNKSYKWAVASARRGPFLTRFVEARSVPCPRGTAPPPRHLRCRPLPPGCSKPREELNTAR